MPRIRYETPHSLADAEAQARLRAAIDRFSAKYRFKASWERPDHAKISGPGLSGTLDLPPGRLVFHLELSILLAPLRSRIEAEVVRELQGALRERQPAPAQRLVS
jgi:putative polyhydroxyalkanoate system protein